MVPPFKVMAVVCLPLELEPLDQEEIRHGVLPCSHKFVDLPSTIYVHFKHNPQATSKQRLVFFFRKNNLQQP